LIVLRKIFGAVCEQGEWRIRTNDEVYKFYGELQLVVEVKRRRLQYLGHVVRMEEDGVPKKILDQYPGSKRKPGRSRKRCHQGSGSAWDSRLEEAGLVQERMGEICRRGQGPSWTVAPVD
jgi:hypothetical protein